MKHIEIRKEKPKIIGCVTLCCAISLIVFGCATQPSRSQTQTIERSLITIYGCECPTNGVPLARGDCLTQNMAIATTGNEDNRQGMRIPFLSSTETDSEILQKIKTENPFLFKCLSEANLPPGVDLTRLTLGGGGGQIPVFSPEFLKALSEESSSTNALKSSAIELLERIDAD